jgi:N-acetylglutamate synthase-like GNAT family acetyltransferase
LTANGDTLVWRRGEHSISTDPGRLDIDFVHRFLSQEAYWSPGIARATVERSIEHSIVFGLYRGSEQVGFARVVTDRAAIAYLADVFVVSEHRDRGLGKWLIETVLSHPDLQGLRKIFLGTADAHSLYERFGFRPVDPGRMMERSSSFRRGSH